MSGQPERAEEMERKYIDDSIRIKKFKDPSAPKRARSGYMLYCEKTRDTVRKSLPKTAQFADIIKKKMAKNWKALDNKEKVSYNKLAVSLLNQEKLPAAQRAQVRIIDGQLVVAEPQAPEESAPEVEEKGLIEVRGDDAPGATSASYTNRVPSERWTLEETRRFYDALRRFGTDFTMMRTAFPGRTQRQLKNKFKRENRTQSALVSLALDASIAVDLKAPMVIEAAPVTKPIVEKLREEIARLKQENEKIKRRKKIDEEVSRLKQLRNEQPKKQVSVDGEDVEILSFSYIRDSTLEKLETLINENHDVN